MIAYDVWPKVLSAINHIGQGRTVTAACDLVFLSVPMFEKCVDDTPEMRDLYDDAIRRGNDAMADALISIDNHKVHGRSDAKMAKVISDNIKWVLARRDQKRFGDKIEVKHEITADRVITAALEAARSRLAPPQLEQVSYAVVDRYDEADELRELLS